MTISTEVGKVKKLFLYLLVVLFSVVQVAAQKSKEEKRKDAIQKIVNETNIEKLVERAAILKKEFKEQKKKAIEWANRNNVPIKTVLKNGTVIELMGFKNGRPIYYSTRNSTAAKSVGTDKVQPGGSSGLNLRGEGVKIGIWDGGQVHRGHQAFYSSGDGYRVTYVDSLYMYGGQDSGEVKISDHATHVAGTMIADNDEPSARGMADKARLDSYEWNYDLVEMQEAALPTSSPLLLSNHSYGPDYGWREGDDGWYWGGRDEWFEDYSFGSYNDTSWTLDALAKDAPYYTIVWAAGNDRGKGGEPGDTHKVWIDNQ